MRQIVAADARAGAERTDRTRYLGAISSLVLTEPLFEQFAEIKLTKPFDKNLLKKKNAMKAAKEGFEKLLAYEVGDVTSAATYYIAEMYYSFSRALVESERPDDLSALEKEQYELAIEEQAYPFEEKAIQVHEKNLELMSLGIFSSWIENSFGKLAKLVPARYAKFEESSGYITAVDKISYAALTNPAPIIVTVAPVTPTPPVQPVVEEVVLQEPIAVVAPPSAEVAEKAVVTSKKPAKAKKAKAASQVK